MKRICIYVLMSVLLLFSFSCTMKEDRMECPCYVSVQTDTDMDCLVTFYDPSGSILDRKVMAAKELCTGENYTSIRKGDFYVSVLKGYSDMELLGGRTVSCRSGMQSDSLWCCSEREYAVDDDLLVNVSMQKQYANVTLDFSPAGETYPYDIRLSSPLNAMDLLTLEAVAGKYDIRPVVGWDMTASFRMTRQNAEQPIYLYVYEKGTGREVVVFDLNWYIARTGYSWDAEYLSDIRIIIDFAKLNMSVVIDDWEQIITFKFEI